ncbi:MAG: dienelactone hydrolase family protein [Actinomycetota bacterium]
MGEMVSFKTAGGEASGYLVKADGPGVMVVQEWWGLNDQIKRVADRFAAEGFTALAPDFYHGDSAQIGKEPDKAGKLFMAVNADRFTIDAKGAVQYLYELTGKKVGAVGYCMGGQLALMTASVAPDQVAAVIDMYGIHPNIKPDYSKMSAAVLALFAERDASIPAEAQQALRNELKKAGVTFEVDVIPGVDHAFMNEERADVYNKAAADEAWSRGVAWFRKFL